MKHLIVENNIIINKIVADEIFASEISALPDYYGADIGQEYNPPKVLTTEEKVQILESQLKASIQSNAMLEECLVEMAEVVYA